MYIVAIGWLYVILLIAITAKSFFTGLFTFVVYGLGPVAILLWFMGAPIRKKRRAYQESLRQESLREAAQQPVDASNGADAQRDQ